MKPKSIQEKRDALKTLLLYTHFFDDDMKNKLLKLSLSMTEEEVDQIGRFLALEKKKSLGLGKHMLEDKD